MTTVLCFPQRELQKSLLQQMLKVCPPTQILDKKFVPARDLGKVAECRLQGWGPITGKGRYSFVCQHLLNYSGHHSSSYAMDKGVKHQEREADYHLTCKADIENAYNLASMTTLTFMATCFHAGWKWPDFILTKLFSTVTSQGWMRKCFFKEHTAPLSTTKYNDGAWDHGRRQSW
jgi:hypothetical protein